MIEQYNITTTPRYNFPQPAIDTALPHRFLEQSVQSLRQVQHPIFQLNQQAFQQVDTNDQDPTTLQLNPTPIQLKPNCKETTIAAIDTSTIKIGETSTGIIIAIRGATIWKQNRAYRYTRLGPFVFHITEDNKKEVYNTLERSYFTTQYETAHFYTPSLLQIPTRLASLLERWLQTMIAKTVTNGIILLDGSLTSGTVDTPVHRMKEILELARKNQNEVLAFSKMTMLRTNGVLITDQLPSIDPPYLIETTGLRLKPPTTLLGDIYVARLGKSNFAFRLDIDKQTPVSKKVEAVEKLLGNDLYSQNYPETLRLSHILCTFTANEVLAIQHFITRKHGIRMINRPDMHRLLFGPFSKGEIYS